MHVRQGLVFITAFVGGWALACTPDSPGTQLGQLCINGQCQIGYECVANYCIPAGGEATYGGDGDPGDGDPGDGDPGDGDPGDGDPGDGDPGDGDPGDGDPGDGDPGDGDPGDGDGDPCQVGTLGCACDAGVCAPGLICNMDYACVEQYCGDGFIAPNEDCDGADLDGFDCYDLGYLGGGVLSCDPVTCQYDASGCSNSTCGNGIVNVGEQCDGNNLNGFDCQDLGYLGGFLACDPITCTYDASGCTTQ